MLDHVILYLQPRQIPHAKVSLEVLAISLGSCEAPVYRC